MVKIINDLYIEHIHFIIKDTGYESPCYLWIRSLNTSGYPHAKFFNNDKLVHRFIYELNHGPIPKNNELDHLCNIRNCINDNHLELVTKSINSRRSFIRGRMPSGAFTLNKKKTHCPKGHEYNEKNTYKTKTGARLCRVCSKERDKRRSSYHN